jgi:hypothetical protein
MLAANFRQVTAENANSVVPRRCGSAAGDEAGSPPVTSNARPVSSNSIIPNGSVLRVAPENNDPRQPQPE